MPRGYTALRHAGRDARTERHDTRYASCMLQTQTAHSQTHPCRKSTRAGRIRPWQNQGDFPAAISSGTFAFPAQEAGDRISDRTQAFVSCGVSVTVVVILKTIDIDHDD